MVSKSVASCLSLALFGTARCSAFAIARLRSSPMAGSIVTTTSPHRHRRLLQAENADRGDVDVDGGSLLSSLPSPEAIKQNVMEGELGARGEQYVVAQFGLLLLIAIGSVPVLGDGLASLLGPALIVAGLSVVYRAAADLKDNLSPWPVPVDPSSGRGSLVSAGIYAQVRHPMYSGLLCGMVGLGLVTDSVARLFLAGILFVVLDAKSDYEEEKLVQAYGDAYEAYRETVPGKFLPPSLNAMSKSHDKNS